MRFSRHAQSLSSSSGPSSGGPPTELLSLLEPHVTDAEAGRLRSELIEAVIAESEDESLMDRYLAGEELSVADLVADAARATGERLRSSRTVTTEAISSPPGGSGASHTPPHGDPWAAATRRDDGAA